MAKGKYTTVGSVPLAKNEDGVPASGSFKYSSVVGIMLYLSGHTRPYIYFAINCCARYMFFPKHFHEVALKKISRYLKLTRDRGFNLNINWELFNIDSYPGADFSGMCVHDNLTDLACVNSHTGYAIKISDCIVLWK